MPMSPRSKQFLTPHSDRLLVPLSFEVPSQTSIKSLQRISTQYVRVHFMSQSTIFSKEITFSLLWKAIEEHLSGEPTARANKLKEVIDKAKQLIASGQRFPYYAALGPYKSICKKLINQKETEEIIQSPLDDKEKVQSPKIMKKREMTSFYQLLNIDMQDHDLDTPHNLMEWLQHQDDIFNADNRERIARIKHQFFDKQFGLRLPARPTEPFLCLKEFKRHWVQELEGEIACINSKSSYTSSDLFEVSP